MSPSICTFNSFSKVVHPLHSFVILNFNPKQMFLLSSPKLLIVIIFLSFGVGLHSPILASVTLNNIETEIETEKEKKGENEKKTEKETEIQSENTRKRNMPHIYEVNVGYSKNFRAKNFDDSKRYEKLLLTDTYENRVDYFSKDHKPVLQLDTETPIQSNYLKSGNIASEDSLPFTKTSPKN